MIVAFAIGVPRTLPPASLAGDRSHKHHHLLQLTYCLTQRPLVVEPFLACSHTIGGDEATAAILQRRRRYVAVKFYCLFIKARIPVGVSGSVQDISVFRQGGLDVDQRGRALRRRRHVDRHAGGAFSPDRGREIDRRDIAAQ